MEYLRSRTIPVPEGLLALFRGLSVISRAADPMVCGRSLGAAAPRALSVRQAERIVQKAGLRAGILKRVTSTNLRNTYAHRRLLCPEQGASTPRRRVAGHNIREVQQAMGHRAVTTTLRYQACLPNASNPLDPESQATVLRQTNALLSRLTMVLATLHRANPKGP